MLICGPWPINETCSGGIPADPMLRTPDQASAVQAASELLWLRTGQIFDVCPVTVFPCGEYCRTMTSHRFYPHITNGVWMNSCGCGDGCSCSSKSQVRLPGPVIEVTQVIVDAVVVAPADYHIDSPDLLVRDVGSWPSCGGSMQVDYTWGTDIPESGKRAVSLLAAQLLESCAGGICRTSQTADGQSGIPEVDNWVLAVNPNGLVAFPFVFEDNLVRQPL